MVSTFFQWLRTAAHNAVLAGVQDAVRTLAGDEADAYARDAAVRLQDRLTAALPELPPPAADPADAPAKPARKAR